MSLSLRDVVDAIDQCLARMGQPSNAVARARRDQLEKIRAFLLANGFPRGDDEKCDLSLVPLVFQEANYDDLKWTDKDADLDHVAPLFDVDFAVGTGGLTRQEADDATFGSYVARSMKCIDGRVAAKRP